MTELMKKGNVKKKTVTGRRVKRGDNLKGPFIHRSTKPIKELANFADITLQACTEIFDAADRLDTAVRATVSTGLAYLLHSAYDSQAVNLGLEGLAFSAFPDSCTAEWFRNRGFAEWFCIGAGNLFHSSPPRVLNPFLVFKPSKKGHVIVHKVHKEKETA